MDSIECYEIFVKMFRVTIKCLYFRLLLLPVHLILQMRIDSSPRRTGVRTWEPRNTEVNTRMTWVSQDLQRSISRDPPSTHALRPWILSRFVPTPTPYPTYPSSNSFVSLRVDESLPRVLSPDREESSNSWVEQIYRKYWSQ